MDATIEKVQQNNKARSKSKFLKNVRQTGPFLFMLLPGLVVLIINNYIPMIGVVMSFEDYRFDTNFINSLITSEKVGFKNFEFIFANPDIFEAVRNTVLYNVAFILLDIIIPVALAIALTEIWSKKASKFYQSSIFLPYFLSWIVIAYLLFALISSDNGFINKSILSPLGIPVKDFYNDVGSWPPILILGHLWKWTGYNIVIYLASISGISEDYYEAASLDGATKWDQIRYITLPMLKTVIVITSLLAVGRIFNSDFGLFYNLPMNQGALYSVTQTMDTYVFMAMRNSTNMSMPAAAGLFQAVIGCITVFTANMITRKIDKDSALF